MARLSLRRRAMSLSDNPRDSLIQRTAESLYRIEHRQRLGSVLANLARELADARREIAILRRENTALRAQLGRQHPDPVPSVHDRRPPGGVRARVEIGGRPGG